MNKREVGACSEVLIISIIVYQNLTIILGKSSNS